MVVYFDNLNSTSGLKKLDEYLRDKFYITGSIASKDDIYVYAELSGPPSLEYVSVSRWYKKIEAQLSVKFGEGQGVKFESSTFISEDAPASPHVADTKASIDTDDDDDLFGEEIEKKKAAEEHATTAESSLNMKLFENLRSRFSAILTMAREIEKDKDC